jgi:GAF domain-containing protein
MAVMREGELSDQDPVRRVIGRNYIRVTIGKKKSPGTSARDDGRQLASQCLEYLDDRRQFPPRLLVLWATPAFRPGYPELLGGIRERMAEEACGEVPLIGSSVAVCLFDMSPHEEGAVLFCLASRFLEAKVTVATGAREDPKGAVTRILDELGIPRSGVMNPRGDQLLLTFVPGYAEGGDPATYRAHEIVSEFCLQTRYRLHMFGGVSSGGLEPDEGWQFVGNRVYRGAAAAALIRSEVAYGTGLNQGLAPTGAYFQVDQLSEDGRTIESLVGEDSPEQVVSQMNSRGQVFAAETTPGERVVVEARVFNGKVRITREISRRVTLRVMETNREVFQRSDKELKESIVKTYDLPRERLVGLMGIGSVSRYHQRERVGYDLPEALRDLSGDIPGVEYAGCYMDGEIGIDRAGRSGISNWSIANLFFADNVPETLAHLRGFHALMAHSPAATTASTVLGAMSHVLRCIDEAGYSGGMLSLVMEDGEWRWIMPQAALGERWGRVVMPVTRRLVGGEDILARVVRRKEPDYVRDTRDFVGFPDDPDVTIGEGAGAGEVISFYATPLLDENLNVFGVLQVDLGDMSDIEELGNDQREVLRAIEAMAAAAINRAISTEELELSRKFDRAISECLDFETIEGAAQSFVEKAVDAINCRLHAEAVARPPGPVEVGRIFFNQDRLGIVDAHVRLWDRRSKSLRLVGGVGDYFDYARHVRLAIGAEDDSHSAELFRSANNEIVINSTRDNPRFRRQPSHTFSEALGLVLRKYLSIAIFAIDSDEGKSPLGTFCVYSEREWFFTPSLLKSLKAVTQRLSVLLRHVRQKAELRQTNDLNEFLLGIKPENAMTGGIRESLNECVMKLARMAKAEVASCFLQSESSSKLVLRAAYNWKEEGWLDAAWYDLGEGLTGKLARKHLSEYIPDLRKVSLETGPDKYLRAMFGTEGEKATGADYEVIALPLRFADTMGIVTLHRRKTDSDGSTGGFATTDMRFLTYAAIDLAAFVSALLSHDEDQWRHKEKERIAKVDDVLIKHLPLRDMLNEVCEVIAEQYQAHSCAIYLRDTDKGLLSERFRHSPRPDRSPRLAPDETAKHRERVFAHRGDGPKMVDTRRPQSHRFDDPSHVRFDNTLDGVFLRLSNDDKPIGVLEILWPEDSGDALDPAKPLGYVSGEFPHYDPDYFLSLASHVAAAISRVHAYEAYEKALSATKGLTGMALFLHDNSHKSLKISKYLKILLNKNKDDISEREIFLARDAVRDLLELFDQGKRLGRELFQLEFNETDIESLLQRAILKLDQRAVIEGVRIERDQNARIRASVGRDVISICFETIIENAIEALSRKDRYVDERTLAIVLSDDGNEWVATFTDNGPGMGREDVETINRMEPLGEDSMGLFLVSILCSYHFGRLHVESGGPSGTTVSMHIPFERL